MLHWNARPRTTTTNIFNMDNDSSSIALGLKNIERGRSVDLILFINNNTLADTFQDQEKVKPANVLWFNFKTTKKLRDKKSKVRFKVENNRNKCSSEWLKTRTIKQIATIFLNSKKGEKI